MAVTVILTVVAILTLTSSVIGDTESPKAINTTTCYYEGQLYSVSAKVSFPNNTVGSCGDNGKWH